MPELPDVEAFRAILLDCARGRTIARVEVHDPGVLHGVDARHLGDALEGRRFTEPGRRGKWLLAHTGGPTVLVHFGMTGRLVCGAPDEPRHPHDRVEFVLAGGRRLRYRDQRKLKGLWLADRSGVARLLDSQGPDATEITRDAFDALLSDRRGAVKAVLTDQAVLAGLGNLLADEILWRSRVRPQEPAAALTQERRHRLHRDMRTVLRTSVRAGHVPPENSWLTGHRTEPDPHCPRCGTPLSRTRVGGRTTFFCPRCQRAGG